MIAVSCVNKGFGLMLVDRVCVVYGRQDDRSREKYMSLKISDQGILNVAWVADTVSLTLGLIPALR